MIGVDSFRFYIYRSRLYWICYFTSIFQVKVKLLVDGAEDGELSGLSASFGSLLPTKEDKGIRLPAVFSKPLNCCASFSSKVYLSCFLQASLTYSNQREFFAKYYLFHGCLVRKLGRQMMRSNTGIWNVHVMFQRVKLILGMQRQYIWLFCWWLLYWLAIATMPRNLFFFGSYGLINQLVSYKNHSISVCLSNTCSKSRQFSDVKKKKPKILWPYEIDCKTCFSV